LISIKKFSIYLTAFFIFFCSNIVVSDNNIYYVDIDYLLNNSLAGKSIIIGLNKKTEFNKKNFEENEKSLKKEETSIILKKNILSENEYLKEVQLFKKKVEDYKLSRNKTINQISKIKNDAQRTLIQSLTPILKDYAKKNSISYIIPRTNIIIGKKELDITNSILEILNSKIKDIKLQ
tara:strand:+ start:629 stop:1162 length:534 start_codon:yes stop_codon:yes gene_type:complete